MKTTDMFLYDFSFELLSELLRRIRLTTPVVGTTWINKIIIDIPLPYIV